MHKNSAAQDEPLGWGQGEILGGYQTGRLPQCVDVSYVVDCETWMIDMDLICELLSSVVERQKGPAELVLFAFVILVLRRIKCRFPESRVFDGEFRLHPAAIGVG